MFSMEVSSHQATPMFTVPAMRVPTHLSGLNQSKNHQKTIEHEICYWFQYNKLKFSTDYYFLTKLKIEVKLKLLKQNRSTSGYESSCAHEY